MRGSLSTSRCIALLILAAAFVHPGRARAECDPDVTWEVYRPTGDVAEILTEGQTAWIAAQGGVIRVDLSGVAGGHPVQTKITDQDGLISTDITCAARDSFGNLWVGTREQGVSIFDAQGKHVADLSSQAELYSDLVLAMGSRGNQVVVVSADEFTPQGNPKGGGFVIVTVTQDGAGHFTFARDAGIAPALEVGRDVLAKASEVWLGTSGQGLYRWDDSLGQLRQVLSSTQGLLSNNVKKVVEAPHYPSGSVLWLGTGAGLQTYEPVSGTLETIDSFTGQNILDLWAAGTTMYVLSETGGTSRDLYTIDLNLPPTGVRIPRSSCTGDTTYVPREVAVDSAGRVVLGTRDNAYMVREGLTWYCPPPLGPHHAQIAGLALAPSGTLYFGTGDRDHLRPGDGVGLFSGTGWSAIRHSDGLIADNMTEVLVWGDGTLWFGSSVDAFNGGLDHYFPETGAIEPYYDTAVVPTRRTLGRNVRSLRTDAAGNLWVVYGQSQPSGGLSLIQAPPSLQVTNYDFSRWFTGTKLLRDMAFDSHGRIWVCTSTTNEQPAELYVVDTKGTLTNLSDDDHADYNMPSQLLLDLGECKSIEIDSSDRIWIAGDKGLALGQIGSGLSATWQLVLPTATQAGGRNPLPYEYARLDWDDNLWLGTGTNGLVRVSKDLTTWSWFEQSIGCPLPDQAIRGIYVDKTAHQIWVGTAAGGVARLDLSGVRSPGTAKQVDPRPYPNPWHPNTDGVLHFGGIPPDQIVDLRIFTLGGELVREQLGVRGEKTWNGLNKSESLVEAGVYVVTARATTGATYEGKVAVLK